MKIIKISVVLIIIILSISGMVVLSTCQSGEASSDSQDKAIVEIQQKHYLKIHPVPFYDYSIPRDILIQIYDVVTTRTYTTYTVIESITGKTFFHGVSIGYGIPADTSLTNPLKIAAKYYQGGFAVTEQAEPNGLFSSKNTDGTWVLFVQSDGSITPIYTEHKVTTFPFAVEMNGDGSWIRADDKPSAFTIEINK